MSNPPSTEKRDFARQLRRESTKAERLLWFHLRDRKCLGFKFRRQQPIGPYIADFVCFNLRLVVELDGYQHDLPKNIEYDKRRTRWLEVNGYTVVRFWNTQLYVDLPKVVAQIEERVRALTLPSPANGRGDCTGPTGAPEG